jgi:hypothetical protein
VVQVLGTIRPRDEGVDFSVEKIQTLDMESDQATSITVSLPMARVTRSTMDALKQTLTAYPGASSVWFKMVNARHTKTFRLADKVTASLELVSDLKALLGASCVEVGGLG